MIVYSQYLALIAITKFFKCPVNNNEQIQAAIKGITYHSGWTHTGEAVKCACDNILTVPCGLPNQKSYCECPFPIDVVIITDGKSNGNLEVCKETYNAFIIISVPLFWH